MSIYSEASKYVPSSIVKNAPALKGLRAIVSDAQKHGFKVYVDYDEGYLEQVNANNVSMSIYEADSARLHFVIEDKCIGWLYAIADNGGDQEWLADYSTSLDLFVNPVMGWE